MCMLLDPAREPAGFFLIHFTSLNYNRPSHDRILLSKNLVVQNFLQLSEMRADGEGSIAYPYFPSREHHCKPAQGEHDFIDIVNLDGWTVDFLCARIAGQRMVGGEHWRSRQGVGPIETLLDMGTERGLHSMMTTTATTSTTASSAMDSVG